MLERIELEIAGALRRLLRSRYVIRSRNEGGFRLIVEHRRRLQEIADSLAAFLEINEPLGIAYLRPMSEEIEEQLGIRLSRPRMLGALASALLIHLRHLRLQFYLQPTGDDVPVTGVADMREFLSQFSQSRIDSQFERQFRKCLDELADLQVIIETQQNSGYYEITPLCDLLLPADQIQEIRVRAQVYFTRPVDFTRQASSPDGVSETSIEGEGS